MVELDKEIQKTSPPANGGFMVIQSLEGAMKCAEIIASSSFCPKGMIGKAGDIVVALQMGLELGLKPMQALQNIAVINGRPSLWGDAMLAVCRQSPEFEYIKEEFIEKDNLAICRIKRRNEPEVEQKFSEADAKKAQLWGKAGPWTQYPRRMLQMRARGFALRDSFPDMLRGILPREEAEDMPRERVDYSRVGITIEGESSDNLQMISDEQVKILRSLAEESSSQIPDVCNVVGVSRLEDLNVSQWSKLCMMAERKIKKKSKMEKNDELAINKIFEPKQPVDVVEMTESAREFFGE